MSENKIVLGYDLQRDSIQISYMLPNSDIPKTFAFREDIEQYNLPMLLCKRNKVNQWTYGEEALENVRKKEGVLIENLLELAYQGEPVKVKDSIDSLKTFDYDPVELLGLFIKKSFSKMGFLLGGYSIEALMFTTPVLDQRMLHVLKKATQQLTLSNEKIFFQTRKESVFHYVVNQPKELRSYQVGVLDFSGENLVSYRVESNYKTQPIVTVIHEKSYPEIKKWDDKLSITQKDAYLERLDAKLLELSKRFVDGNIMTSVFLIGDAFLGEWYNQTLHFLCKSRRVFGGNNLYSKGAAYAAAFKLLPKEQEKQFVFLGEDKLKTNVGLMIQNGMDEEYMPLLDAGNSWYEEKASFDFMLMEGKEITFLITPMMNGARYEQTIEVDGFENRPSGTVRLHLDACMKSEKEMEIRITDCGFGEFYAKTTFEKILTLKI